MSNVSETALSSIETKLQSETSDLTNDLSLLQAVKGKIERLEGRKMRFSAKIQVPYSLEQVWQVLTDYEAFPEFMSNLVQIQRLEHPTGNIRLDQVLKKKFMGLQFKAHMIMDIEENSPHEIREYLVEGDFQSFLGSWRLDPCLLGEKTGVNLSYELLVVPKRIFPIALVEYVLSQDMPKTILAVKERLEKLFGAIC
ncbi:MAG: SRPBCC family protein [Nostoc indistinguendum CM1-VF10]|jgi:ribosome-associated toxin RatA of RatAB toxin-antitoxin module|nr:SRPBCC family protein [Nostoc indistinguendum CM1-VF10]